MRMLAMVVLLIQAGVVAAGESLADRLKALSVDTIVLGPVKESPLAGMLGRDAKAMLRLANTRDQEAWSQVRTRADWEKFRAGRLNALRTSLGQFPPAPAKIAVSKTKTLIGDGFEVDNLLFESRPGLGVTANLYRPAKPGKSMPGIMVIHSHQQPKNTSYRQDMGMTWARAGCAVLIVDLPGHGERRQHPFHGAKDYAKPFPARQDYYFRFDASLQMYAIGDTLMGWFVWDLMRSLDVLLAQPGVDPERIIVVSEPAGGGDVAAVFAALEPRVACLMVNNFGGPQPETPYPLPRDAEQSFDYAGGGSWESTRGLYRSARDGFLHWTIVASLAPRRLIYTHEFYWDRDDDPVWARLRKVYGFYQAEERLAGSAGHGFVSGQPPANSHWLAYNREILYPILEDWFRIPNPKKEYNQRLPEKDLEVLGPQAKFEPVYKVVAAEGAERLKKTRAALAGLNAAQKKAHLRNELAHLLGDVEPKQPPVVRRVQVDKLDGVQVERVHLWTEPGIVVPVVLLLPQAAATKKVPVVIGLADKGKQTLLRQRAAVVAELLEKDVAVCLPDLRGWGESSPGENRERGSGVSGISASYLMAGETLLGGRLRDLRGVLTYLRQRPDIAPRFGLWSESLAPVNAKERDIKVPHGIDRPDLAEPSAGLLALLAGLFEDQVQAIGVRGGLYSFESLLHSPFVYVPHEAMLPGVLRVGDVSDWMQSQAPRPLYLENLVDGRNRVVDADVLKKTFAEIRRTYKEVGAEGQFDATPPPDSVARWLVRKLEK